MRKSYLMMAAAATIFAACSETDFVNPVPETEQEIGFDNHVGKTTRAEITSEAALATEGGFVVWGWKTPTAATLDWSAGVITQIFEKQVVSGGDGAWTYSPTKYWDKNSTYNFYAAAPATPASGTYECTDAATGMITITDVKSGLAKAEDTEDFLIDRDGAKKVDGADHGDKVNFDFNHVMAKVSIQLKRNVAEKITVKSITMSGWNNNLGTFEQDAEYMASKTNTDEWSLATDNPATAGTVTFGQGYVLYSEPAVGEELDLAVSTATPVAVEDSYIMVPQTVGTLTFTLDYTITYSDNLVEEFKSQTGTLTAQTWGTDTHTTYTILVGPEPIEFEVNTVSRFTNTSTGNLPIE